MSGEKEKWKKMEKRRVPESGQMHTDVQFHTYLPLGESETSKDASHCQSLPHIENTLRETAPVSGGRFWGPHKIQDQRDPYS